MEELLNTTNFIDNDYIGRLSLVPSSTRVIITRNRDKLVDGTVQDVLKVEKREVPLIIRVLVFA